MINKKLEKRLLKAGYSVWIKVLEECEYESTTKKNKLLIKVDKKKKFTDSFLLNRMIETYLKKLEVQVEYVDMKKELPKLKNKKECKNVIHLPFQKKLNKDEKKEIYKNYKYPLFNIDGKVFVQCPECLKIEEITE